MNRRSVLGKMSAVISAVIVWQAVFVAPAPVLANDPTPGELIPCGDALICGGGSGPGPDSNIVVTGPEDHIVQTDADAQWGFIENEAKSYVAGIHGIPVDSQLTDWGRGELRAYMLNRLLDIAAKPAGQRTSQEQAALVEFQQLVKQKQIDSAQDALDLYHSWDNDACHFHWPSEVATDVNFDINQEELGAYCAGPGGLGALFGGLTPPSYEDFKGFGTAVAFKKLATDPDSQRVQNEIETAEIFFGAMGAAAVAAGITTAIIASSAALAAAIGAGILPTSAALAAGASVSSAAIASGFTAAAGTATIAVAVAGAVLIAIFAAIVIAIAIWQQVTKDQIPVDLQADLDSYSAANYTPDIDSMAHDSSGAGYETLKSVFTLQTLPDYSNLRTNNPPAHGAGDPTFDIQQITCEIPVNQIIDCGPISLPSSNTISPEDWSDTPAPQTAYLANGWWVNASAADNGDATLHLTVPFVAPNGEKWTAGPTKVSIDASGIIPAHIAQGLILDDSAHPENSKILKPGDSFDYKAVNGLSYRATLVVPDQNYAPIVNPEVSGDLQEGGTVTFHANAVDPNGDSMTYQWWIEPGGGGPAILVIGSDGKSQIDHCYTDPITADNDFLLNCPWAVLSGSDPTYTYHDSGDLHVHLITDDGNGGTTSDVFQVHIANDAPAVTMDNPGTTFSIDEGGSVDLPGSFNDAGDDQVDVQVDWGDGSASETQHYPCYFHTLSLPQGCTLHLPLEPAAHPQTFDFQHTYPDDPPGSTTDYAITLTATDDDGGVTTKNFSATVGNVAPQLTVGCGLLSPPSLGINTFGCQTRYGEAPFTVPLNGFFDDPGADTWKVDIDWGDGSAVQHFTYPCPSGDPCPFQTTSSVNLYQAQANRVFINTSHQYTVNRDMPYPITVSIDDGDGGTDSDNSAAAAINVPAAGDTSDPTISIITPADGATYDLNQSVAADFSCSDNDLLSCVGTVNDGSDIDTSTTGSHAFTVLALDGSFNSASKTVHYTVQDSSAASDTTDPTVTLTAPAEGATYTLGQVVKSDYSCADETAIQSCVGTVADNTNINTSSLGAHTFTVTATDTSANTASATDHYTVVYPFSWESPLLAAPTVNDLTAGAKTRLWFSLGGKHGRITRMHTRVRQVNCDTLAPMTRYANGNGVSKVAYNQGTHMYYIVWKPKAGWAGTCREFELRLKDGTNQDLYFHLT